MFLLSMDAETRRSIATAKCCREWPVLLGARINRCGICGQVPSIVDTDAPWNRKENPGMKIGDKVKVTEKCTYDRDSVPVGKVGTIVDIDEDHLLPGYFPYQVTFDEKPLFREDPEFDATEEDIYPFDAEEIEVIG